MKRQDPILIAAPPRSGTTMLAAVLHAHGVWVGRGRTTRYPGTNMDFASENQDIKNVFKEIASLRGYKNWTTPIPDFTSPIPRIKDRIEDFVPEDTPWLVKTSWNLIFWEAWTYAYPKARWLFPYREATKILDSMERHPGMRKHPWHERSIFLMDLTVKKLHAIEAGVDHHFFEIEDLIAMKKKTIKELFQFLRIDPDYDTISGIIKPEMMKV